jgi:hypothetical protein
MPRRTASALAVSAIATASVALAVPNASADLVMHCVGTGGAVTVPSDLLIPAGKSCSLNGTTITGNVRVAAGANLVINGGTISGEVRVAADGYLDATNTKVSGQIVLAAGGYGVYLRDANVTRVTVQPKGEQTIEGFLYVEQSTIEGTVTSSVGEVRLDGTEVTGNVSTNGTYYTDLHDSFVDGTLSVLNSATGSVVCGSAVQGNATFAGNLQGVQLGPNGVLDSCASGGYWARDVSITNTTGAVTVDDNIINGQLVVTSNNPAARVASNNRIRGGVVGEQGASAAAANVAPRVIGAEQRAQDRRLMATKSADAAGQAAL